MLYTDDCQADDRHRADAFALVCQTEIAVQLGGFFFTVCFSEPLFLAAFSFPDTASWAAFPRSSHSFWGTLMVHRRPSPGRAGKP